MKKNISILIIIFSTSFYLSAQKDTTTYNIQNSEIGIDFQDFFRNSSEDLGSSLIYRKRIGQKDSTFYDKTKVLRLKVGGFASLGLNKKETIETELENITEGNGIIESENNLPPSSRYRISILGGIEWQTQKKRLQYYTGFETGYAFDKTAEITNTNYTGNELRLVVSRNNRVHSVLLNAIGGCKFFLSSNFSVGLETSIEGSFNVIRNTNTSDNRLVASKRITTTKNNTFIARFDYLNALYFSYYY